MCSENAPPHTVREIFGANLIIIFAQAAHLKISGGALGNQKLMMIFISITAYCSWDFTKVCVTGPHGVKKYRLLPDETGLMTHV